MATDPSYYNTDYASIAQDYRDAENRRNVPPNQELEANDRTTQRVPKPKRISRRCSENYDLPDEDSSSVTASQISHRRRNDSLSGSENNGNQRSWMTWKFLAIASIVIIFLGLCGMVAYFLIDLKCKQ